MTKEINYEDKILVLVDGLEIDVSPSDAKWLCENKEDDYKMIAERIYQRPRKTNPFNNPPTRAGKDAEVYAWWHKHQH